MDEPSETLQPSHNEPCYVSLDFDLDDSGTDDERNEDSSLGPLLHSVIEDIAGEQIEICTELSDDNVEIIHLNRNNLQETLPGLEIFTTVPSAENPSQTISLSAGLFCPVTVQWLLENFETKEGVSLPRSTVYNHYISHCKLHDMEPVNAASFGKLIRSIFLGLQTRRLGTRGNSKYHYYGIQIKPESSLNEIQDIIRIEAPNQAAGHRNCESAVAVAATPEVHKVKKKPAETITSGAYKMVKVITPERQAEAITPAPTTEVNIAQEVVAELNGEPLNNATIMEVVVNDSSAQVVEMMSLMNVDQNQQQHQVVVTTNQEDEPSEVDDVDDPINSVYVKTCLELIPEIKFKIKSFKHWKQDLKKIVTVTGHADKGKVLAKKIDKIAALIMESCPKIDYKLTSDIMSRSEVDLFRRKYQTLAEKLVRTALTYRLDEFLSLIFCFWNVKQEFADETVFSKEQLSNISQNDCIRHYVINVDSHIYEILLNSYFPDNVNALPPFVLQLLNNFSVKLEHTVSKAMQDYPSEMRELKTSAAKAFTHIVQSRSKLNVLIDLARPVFQEENRKKINDALANLNILLTSKGKPASESELYQLELFRFAFESINHVEKAGKWLENEIESALRPPKANREEKSIDQLAQEFVLELNCLMHVVCHMAYTDEDVNGLLTLFACFAGAYSTYAIQKRKVMHRNTNLIQYLMETLP